MGDSRSRRKIAQRKHIIEIGLSLFHERGYDNVSVEEIAEAACISRSTFYNFFDSKAGLLLDIPFRLNDDLREYCLSLPDDMPLDERIRAMLAFDILGTIEKYDYITRFDISSITPRTSERPGGFSPSQLDLVAIFKEEIDRALENGHTALHVSSQTAAEAIVAASFFIRRQFFPSREAGEDISRYRDHIDIVLRGIGI